MATSMQACLLRSNACKVLDAHLFDLLSPSSRRVTDAGPQRSSECWN